MDQYQVIQDLIERVKALEMTLDATKNLDRTQGVQYGTDPTDADQSLLYFRVDEGKLYYYDGGWIETVN